MKFNEIQRTWPDLKKRLGECYPDLSPEDLEKTEGGRRQLLQLIEAKYGSTDPKAEEDLDRILAGSDDDETGQ